jgi:hypothetical protein
MTDITERLRDPHSELSGDVYWGTIFAERREAADEIDALRLTAKRRDRDAAAETSAQREEIERLRAALTDIRDLTEHHADADELFGTLFGTASAALTAAKRGDDV